MKNRFLRILIVAIVACVISLLIVKTYAPKKAETSSSKTATVTANSKEKILHPSVEISDTLHETFIAADINIAYELPACAASLLTKHEGYTLQYDEKNEQARWVAYQLTAAETIKQFERTNKFITDPTIPSGSASDRDYRNSGYDRGHLAPASDMGWSAKTMAESFYYSNMSPQVPAFNRGIWKRLEEQVRSWAMELDTIYVVTGPILSGNLQFIGPDQVAVPNYYFKAVFYFHGKDSKAIGFVMENRKLQGSLYDYTITIDSLENLPAWICLHPLTINLKRRLKEQRAPPAGIGMFKNKQLRYAKIQTYQIVCNVQGLHGLTTDVNAGLKIRMADATSINEWSVAVFC